MAFRRDALLAIDGFNPVYLRAGDDVDVCWRLQAKKQRIGFSPSALVWHHHRPSIKAYWRQQVGYGEGEAWLEAHHPEKFAHGTMLWHGRIYSPLPFVRSLSQRRVNSGIWGTAPFPSVYSTVAHPAQLLPHSPGWQALSTLALVASAAAFVNGHIGLTVALLVAGALGWLTTVARCLSFGWQSDLEGVASVHGVASRVAHRLLIAWLHFLQPLARCAGRIRGRWAPPSVIVPARATRLRWRTPSPRPLDAIASARLLVGGSTEARFWSETWTSPDALLREVTGLLRAARPAQRVDVDDGFREDRDVSIGVGIWGWLDVHSLIEEHGGAKCLLRVGLRLRPALIGMVLASSLVLALVLARAAVLVELPWVSMACVLCVATAVSRAAWQTSAAVALARVAVQRAAITAGMMPIPQRGGSRAPWRIRPRVATVLLGAHALTLALLSAGSVDHATSLLRHAGVFGLAPSKAAVRTADKTPPAAKPLGIAGDVAVAPNGDLFFADTRRGVIHRFDVAALTDSVRVRSVLSDAVERQVMFSDARIDSPTSVSIGQDGELYVADARHNRVARINESGDMVVLAGTGIPGFDGDLKPAIHADLKAPNGIAVSWNGDVYIADSGNNRIRMVSAATGMIHTVAGVGEAGPSDADDDVLGDGGPAKLARLSMPMDVAIGPEGDIYIADTGHHRVRVINAATGVITTIAGDGDPRSAGDGGPARAASLAGPAGLALSWSLKGQVTVFVAEYLGGNIRAITRGGAISTVGAPGRFSAPSRLAYRPGGWLYVVDDKGAVTVVNVSRGRSIQVAGVITRGPRHDVVALAGRAVE
jgi:DNA-binding beta-propeller fold protein YncE